MNSGPDSILPEFNSDGPLPAGEYPLTLEALADSLLVCGPAAAPDWD